MPSVFKNLFLGSGLSGLLLLAGCAEQKPPLPGIAQLSPDGKMQTIQITANHGYQPVIVQVKAGVPTQMTLYRDEAMDSCAAEFEIPSLHIKKPLPNRQKVTIQLPPLKPGEIPFSCSMQMMTGKVVVVKDITP